MSTRSLCFSSYVCKTVMVIILPFCGHLIFVTCVIHKTHVSWRFNFLPNSNNVVMANDLWVWNWEFAACHVTPPPRSLLACASAQSRLQLSHLRRYALAFQPQSLFLTFAQVDGASVPHGETAEAAAAPLQRAGGEPHNPTRSRSNRRLQRGTTASAHIRARAGEGGDRGGHLRPDRRPATVVSRGLKETKTNTEGSRGLTALSPTCCRTHSIKHLDGSQGKRWADVVAGRNGRGGKRRTVRDSVLQVSDPDSKGARGIN